MKGKTWSEHEKSCKFCKQVISQLPKDLSAREKGKTAKVNKVDCDVSTHNLISPADSQQSSSGGKWRVSPETNPVGVQGSPADIIKKLKEGCGKYTNKTINNRIYAGKCGDDIPNNEGLIFLCNSCKNKKTRGSEIMIFNKIIKNTEDEIKAISLEINALKRSKDNFREQKLIGNYQHLKICQAKLETWKQAQDVFIKMINERIKIWESDIKGKPVKERYWGVSGCILKELEELKGALE